MNIEIPDYNPEEIKRGRENTSENLINILIISDKKLNEDEINDIFFNDNIITAEGHNTSSIEVYETNEAISEKELGNIIKEVGPTLIVFDLINIRGNLHNLAQMSQELTQAKTFLICDDLSLEERENLLKYFFMTTISKIFYGYHGKTMIRNAANLMKELSEKLRKKESIEIREKFIKARDNNGIIPYYHPIINNKTGKVLSCELLVRMVDPDDNEKIISPYFLNSLFEEQNHEISKIMLKYALLSTIKSNLNFSINLNGYDLEQEDFIKYIEYILEIKYANPKKICLEVLETGGNLSNKAVKNLIYLKENFGFKIALDDFATANSTLGRLKEIIELGLMPDYIKIDKLFIKDIAKKEINTYKMYMALLVALRQFVKRTNALMGINIEIIVEGVEDIETQNIIERLNISKSQGFYFSKPIPGTNLENTIKEIENKHGNN